MSRKNKKEEKREQLAIKDFFDRILPGVLKFYSDHYICGDSYRCVWAIKEYPPSTEEQAILRQLADRTHVTLRIYNRLVDHAEQHRIIQNANRRNRLRFGGDDIQEMVDAEHNLKDVKQLLTNLRTNGETLLHTAVFIELKAADMDKLRELQSDVMMELTRCKISVDRLTLRQLDGFLSVVPFGYNHFGSQYERVLPASSTANLYPINYSGRSDPHGFYIGNDHYGADILLDLDRRTPDKTNSSVLILGNSGEGKSYLLKLLICNLLESGKTVICLDPEQELTWLCGKLGGCYADLMGGQFRINFLEAKRWDVDGEDNPDAPEAFRQKSSLSQHISFLKDFFRAYKPFTHQQVDTLELMLEQLYRKWGISDKADFSAMGPEDWPIAEDLYAVLEDAYEHYDQEDSPLYPRELLRELLLGLHSMCRGAESVYFNGRTNITSTRFLVFGVKDLIHANSSVKDALLFNLLSYLSDQLLTKGNTVAALDELYLWLSNLTTIEYIRNCLKRVRKRNSALILASQNLEDFDIQGVRELTRPLFAIPTHQFLFHGGKVDKKFYMDNLQLESAEYDLISSPNNGVCLFKSGADRNLLDVHAPPHKHALITGGGG